MNSPRQPIESFCHILIQLYGCLYIMQVVALAPLLNLVSGHSDIQVAFIPDQDENCISSFGLGKWIPMVYDIFEGALSDLYDIYLERSNTITTP